MSALVIVAAAVASYLARTDAFAIIAWIVIAVLATVVIFVIYALDMAARHLKSRRAARSTSE